MIRIGDSNRRREKTDPDRPDDSLGTNGPSGDVTPMIPLFTTNVKEE